MKSGEQVLILTTKGAEELRQHAFQLDAIARNILSLIEQGCKTTEAILQRSMFPHNSVVDGLRRLLKKEKMYACVYEGRRHDAGDKLGFLKATVEFALKREGLGEEFRAYLKGLQL